MLDYSTFMRSSGDDSVLLSMGKIKTMEQVDAELSKVCKKSLFEKIADFLSLKNSSKSIDNCASDIEYGIPYDWDRQPSIQEEYPNGFTFEELQEIDFDKFGTLLKQQRLLPPSYDRKPSVINIYRGRKDGGARVKLTFNSKTTDSYRVIGINKYDIDFAVNSSYMYEHSDMLSRAWVDFAQQTRKSWELQAKRDRLFNEIRGKSAIDAYCENIYEEDIPSFEI